MRKKHICIIIITLIVIVGFIVLLISSSRTTRISTIKEYANEIVQYQEEIDKLKDSSDFDDRLLIDIYEKAIKRVFHDMSKEYSKIKFDNDKEESLKYIKSVITKEIYDNCIDEEYSINGDYSYFYDYDMLHLFD